MPVLLIMCGDDYTAFDMAEKQVLDGLQAVYDIPCNVPISGIVAFGTKCTFIPGLLYKKIDQHGDLETSSGRIALYQKLQKLKNAYWGWHWSDRIQPIYPRPTDIAPDSMLQGLQPKESISTNALYPQQPPDSDHVPLGTQIADGV